MTSTQRPEAPAYNSSDNDPDSACTNCGRPWSAHVEDDDAVTGLTCPVGLRPWTFVPVPDLADAF